MRRDALVGACPLPLCEGSGWHRNLMPLPISLTLKGTTTRRSPRSHAERDVPAPMLQGHQEIIWALEVRGDSLFTASADRTVRVWDVTTKQCTKVRCWVAGWGMCVACWLARMRV